RVPEHPALRYAYVGFALKLNQPVNIAPQTLEFDARRTASAVQPFGITLRSETGKTYRRDFGGYGEVETEWKTFRIPLSDFAVPADEGPKLNNFRFTVASHSMRDNIDLQEGTIYLRNLRLSQRTAEAAVKLPDYRTILADHAR